MHLPHDHGHRSEDLQAGMPKDSACTAAAELMKTMGDGKRLQLYWLLCHCEECVVNLAALLGLSSPAVSHHLRVLKEAGLVISRREGKEVYYTAAGTPRTHLLHDCLEEIFEMDCPVEAQFTESQSYDSQIGAVNDIHALLISDLTRRWTIDGLAARFHLSTTTLKTEFKRVFGRPIAAYMKEYRMNEAARLLTQTDLPIADIAARVGYENGSKFTQAFRDIRGILPKDYRKSKKPGDNREKL